MHRVRLVRLHKSQTRHSHAKTNKSCFLETRKFASPNFGCEFQNAADNQRISRSEKFEVAKKIMFTVGSHVGTWHRKPENSKKFKKYFNRQVLTNFQYLAFAIKRQLFCSFSKSVRNTSFCTEQAYYLLINQEKYANVGFINTGPEEINLNIESYRGLGNDAYNYCNFHSRAVQSSSFKDPLKLFVNHR